MNMNQLIQCMLWLFDTACFVLVCTVRKMTGFVNCERDISFEHTLMQNRHFERQMLELLFDRCEQPIRVPQTGVLKTKRRPCWFSLKNAWHQPTVTYLTGDGPERNAQQRRAAVVSKRLFEFEDDPAEPFVRRM
jgi:hypothetical protein